MKKQTIIFIIVVIAISAGYYYSKSQRISNPEVLIQNTEQISQEVAVPLPTEITNLENTLMDLGVIFGVGFKDITRRDITYNIEMEEKSISAEGYEITVDLSNEDDVFTSSGYYIDARSYFLDSGYSFDQYNAGNKQPGNVVDILTKELIICQLFELEDKDANTYRVGAYCGDSSVPQEEVVTDEMTEKTARYYADTGVCVETGTLLETASYNSNSKTWWIDLDPFEKTCSPACVISSDGSTEVNWRCTGVLPPE